MERIKMRQNSDEMLCIQYAARLCLNRGEKIGWYIWVWAVLAELCVFIPDVVPGILQWGLPVLLDMTVVVLSYKFSKYVKIGAMLRNYFDAYVLDLGYDKYDEVVIRENKERSIRLVEKNKVEAEVQMQNTGRDNPPGVKDWYEFNAHLTGIAAVRECQRQNQWWTKEMLMHSVKERIIVATAVVVVFVCLLVAFPDSFWSILVCSTGLLFRSLERVLAYFRFFRVSNDIDAVIQNLSNGYGRKNLLGLQARFEELRSIPVVASNRYHRKNALKNSVVYGRISKP